MKKCNCLMFALAALPMCAVLAETWTDPDTKITWTYTVNNGEATLGTGSSSGRVIATSTSGAITIPSTLGGCQVTSIGDYAFYNCSNLTSVTMPSNVRDVGAAVFSGCEALENVTISENVKKLGWGMFWRCSNLKDVTIPEGVVSIGSYAFEYCTGLTHVTMPSSVMDIGESAFGGCSGIRSVNIPVGVDNIRAVTFSGCSGLMDVTIPSTVTNIGNLAFSDCSGLKSVKITEGVRSIGRSAFCGCTNLTNLILPLSVKDISEDAFSDCNNVKNVTVPGQTCGLDFSSVTNLIITEGVTKIYNNDFDGFQNCRALKKVTIPSSVTKIYGTFLGCYQLEEFVVAAENAYYKSENGLLLSKDGYSVISGINGVVTIPEGVKNIEWGAFQGCRGLVSVTIPEGVTNISRYAFYDCSGLTNLRIPSSVQYIGSRDENLESHIFTGCTSLKRVSVDGNCVVYKGTFPANCLVVRRVSATVYALDSTTDVYDGMTKLPKWRIYWPQGCAYVGVGAVDAGAYQFAYAESDFICTNNAYDVSFYPGGSDPASLTINRRAVALSAMSNSKTYDGTPLTAGVEIGGMGFVDGECEVVATGSQTCVGSSENGVQIIWRGNGKASNYDLTITNGTLTVLPAKVAGDGVEPGDGEVPAGGLSKFDTAAMYDGLGHTIDTNALQAVTLIDPKTISYSLTSNGTYQVEPILFTNACVTSVWYKISAANYEDYVHEAKLTILPREVTLTSGSAEKKYDGEVLVCHECEIAGDGFVDNEGVSLDCTGSQTLLGTSENTFTYEFAEGTLAVNYEITTSNGTLTVVNAGKYATSPVVIEQNFSGSSGEVHFAAVEDGVTIHYTTDGTNPTSNSAVYTGKIVLTDTTRVRAIASKYGWLDSEETDITVHCSAGIVECAYSSVSERYPNSYATMTNVVVRGQTKLTAEFFVGCNALRHVTLSDDLQSVDSDVFDALPNFEWEVVDGYKYCSNWLFGYTESAVESLTHTDTLKGVANGALEGCMAIHYFTCEAGSELTHVGNRAFYGCVKLSKVLLPEGVTDIGDEAFCGCTKMTNFIIPGSVRTIGNAAFKQCTSLTGALFGYGIESIGEEAFHGDWRISEVDIPSSVTNIGKDAFGGDSSIIRAGLRCDIGKKIKDVFSNYAYIREIVVKEGDGEIPDGCFIGCQELDAVRYLGNCPALENDGATLYETGTNTWLVSYVTQGSTDWDGVSGSEALPQAWPLTGNNRRAIAFWDLPTYLCQFDSNGGTLDVQDTYQYSEQNVVLPPEPVQSGYKFAGWWTQPVGGLRVTSDTIFIEGVYTYLYAHWIKGHWVFLDPNGGEVVNDFITYVEEATYGVLPTPVRSGYAFGGWLYDGRVIEPESEINEKADHTLVAQWTANLYSVRYNPNGGVGDEETQNYIYGIEQALRKNTYTRSGYTFIGWATNKSDEVVYQDCEAVSNLTTVANGFVDLYAVWEQGANVDPTNVSFTFGGDEDWTKCYECVVVTNAGEELRYDTIWKSGTITHNQSSVLKANVNGPGKISFWWKVSCEAFRQYKLDYLEFAIDGVPCEPWINGEREWSYLEFEVVESGEHILTWTYFKDNEGTSGEDCGRVCAVVWTPRLETLADYLNSTNLVFTTSGDAVWSGDIATNHDGVASLKSGLIGDGGQSVVETTVAGPGKVSFWWKVSSESFRDYQVDYVSCSVDGAERAWVGGEIDWTNICIVVEGEGKHTVKWIYQKDLYDDSRNGDDCAWLDQVVWESTAEADLIPELGNDATPQEVAAALDGSADARLAECITNAVNYNAYRDWAANVKTPDGSGKAGAQAVKESSNAWFSYAVGSDRLISELPTSEDIKVDEFTPSSESGKFDFTVSIDGVTVSEEALKENLKQVFGLEGSTSLDPNGFSSNNVDIDFNTPENGKVKFTAGPKSGSANTGTFFMKVKVNP